VTAPEKHVVLDSSAVLAAIFEEPGGGYVRSFVRHATMSTVNWSEVLQKLDEFAVDLEVASEIRNVGLALVHFDERSADETAGLWRSTRHAGLSFADRACLVTAARLRIPALTADQRWAAIEGLPAEVVLIR